MAVGGYVVVVEGLAGSALPGWSGVIAVSWHLRQVAGLSQQGGEFLPVAQLSPLLSANMLYLALGASALTVTGALSWHWYRRIHRLPLVLPPPRDIELQAQIAEPR